MSQVFQVDNAANLLSCLLWQYDKATALQTLVQKMQDDFEGNATEFWDNFYTNIFNLETANAFGLAVWGICLGIERPTYTNSSGETVLYSDDMYRLFLQSRALMFNFNASMADYNEYMQFLFPGKPILCLDMQNMKMRFIFYYTPTEEEWSVLNNPDFLPRPSGVEIELVIIAPATVFGFDGSGLAGFDQGTFFA